MTTFVIIVHFIICFILIVAVLLQSGKAADLAGAFGGVGSQTAFGARGTATLLSKITTICAILFMFTSLGLWILSGEKGGSVVSGQEPAKKEVPAATETKKEGQTPEATKQPGAETPQPPAQKTDASKQEPQKKESVPEKKIN